MSDQRAPRVFISYAHDSPPHKMQVLQFAEFLRVDVGLAVHLDRWYDDKRRNWALWANEHMRSADFIMVIASPQLRRRTESSSPSHEGRGAKFEASIILDLLTEDLAGWTERILPVVLKGGSVDDVPTFLNPYSTTRFHVDELSETGVADLIAAITGVGDVPMPAQGPWRGGVAELREKRQILLAGLPALSTSADVHTGEAWIDGIHYSESIVLRRTAAAFPGRSFLEVDLGRVHRRLTAILGVEDDTTENFQVGRIQVYLDNRPLPEVTVARGMPQDLDLDVTGVRRLRLEFYRLGVTGSPLRRGPRGLPRAALNLALGNPVLL
ncbi:SEFIR domain-containing protein [Saccharothrix sp. NPDC042600]|uniref:SEFIR domain-containing protein n=1 Tax=Saccharothrix TaxID=2071 RepID=UPI00340E36E1|nr:hypothetical protein GCM10017745_66970 [Saccharothrix mutabilis subsp. capreolus]